MTKPSPKRPMTPDEIEAAKMLRGVTFPVASWDKRFASAVAALLVPPPPDCNCGLLSGVDFAFSSGSHGTDCPRSKPEWVPMISEKMVPQIWRLVARYRRQVKHPERLKYLRMAELLQAPDLRKRQAAMKLLAKRQRERDQYHAAMKQGKETHSTPTPP